MGNTPDYTYKLPFPPAPPESLDPSDSSPCVYRILFRANLGVILIAMGLGSTIEQDQNEQQSSQPPPSHQLKIPSPTIPPLELPHPLETESLLPSIPEQPETPEDIETLNSLETTN